MSYYYIEAEVKENTHVYFSINQKDKRCFKFNDPGNFKYHLIRLMIGKLNTDDTISSFINGCWGCDRNTDLETTLSPGRYMLAIEVEWASNPNTKMFSISTYSENEIELVQLDLH